MESLLDEILEDLSIELGLMDPKTKNAFEGKEHDIAILTSKIKNAYREIKKERSYPASYSDDAIVQDMEGFYSNIRELALYDYNQYGVEGQTAHSEGGESRTWKSRRECFNGVFSFCDSF
jgi:hypothetical protein